MFRKFIIFLFLIPTICSAQSNILLTYQQVVAQAIQNNYNIEIAQNDARISAVQNTYGNAGFLPKFDVVANGNLGTNNTKQNFSSGLVVNQDNVKSNTLNSGAYLNWTIFDGLKMFATKERLHQLERQGQLSLKLQIENTIEDVTLLYYQIVKQIQLIKGIEAAMQVSDERIKIASTKLKIGSGSNVEVLQARLDLNALRSKNVTQKYLLNEFKNNLLVLTKMDLKTSFSVDTFFNFDNIKSMEEIKESVEKLNRSVLLAQNRVLIATQNIKELRSQSYPIVGLTANYNFARSQNEAGFTLLNQNLGYNTGFTFSWNLFNGWKTQNQVQVAKIQKINSELRVQRVRDTVISAAQSAYTRWLGDNEILVIEEDNIKLSEQSLLITTERLRLGLGNFLETKESQNSYEESITRLVNARYNLKQSETTLKKLTGSLLKEN